RVEVVDVAAGGDELSVLVDDEDDLGVRFPHQAVHDRLDLVELLLVHHHLRVYHPSLRKPDGASVYTPRAAGISRRTSPGRIIDANRLPSIPSVFLCHESPGTGRSAALAVGSRARQRAAVGKRSRAAYSGDPRGPVERQRARPERRGADAPEFASDGAPSRARSRRPSPRRSRAAPGRASRKDAAFRPIGVPNAALRAVGCRRILEAFSLYMTGRCPASARSGQAGGAPRNPP